jgi:hypothetical protein
MKAIKTLFFIVSVMSITSLVHAYEYKFSNNSWSDVLVGIQFKGDIGDTIYKKFLKKGETGTVDFPGVKAGFCLKKVFYIPNPTQAQQKDPQAKDWMDAVWKKEPLQGEWTGGCGSMNANIQQDGNNIVFVDNVGGALNLSSFFSYGKK